MTKRISILVAALCITSNAAFADQHDPVHDYVWMRSSALYAFNACGAKLIPGGLSHYADMIGADEDKLNAAMVAASAVNTGKPYT